MKYNKFKTYTFLTAFTHLEDNALNELFITNSKKIESQIFILGDVVICCGPN